MSLWCKLKILDVCGTLLDNLMQRLKLHEVQSQKTTVAFHFFLGSFSLKACHKASVAQYTEWSPVSWEKSTASIGPSFWRTRSEHCWENVTRIKTLDWVSYGRLPIKYSKQHATFTLRWQENNATSECDLNDDYFWPTCHSNRSRWFHYWISYGENIAFWLLLLQGLSVVASWRGTWKQLGILFWTHCTWPGNNSAQAKIMAKIFVEFSTPSQANPKSGCLRVGLPAAGRVRHFHVLRIKILRP